MTVSVANAAPSPAPLSGTTTSANTGSDPNGVAVVGNLAYVANGASDTVSVVDANTNEIVATIPVDHTPHIVVAKPDGTRVYVRRPTGHRLGDRHRPPTGWSSRSVCTGGAYAQIPGDLAISPDGTKIYVATYDGTVTAIDTASNIAIGPWTISYDIGGMAVSADGKRLYVADKTGVIKVVDTTKLVPPATGITSFPFRPDMARHRWTLRSARTASGCTPST